MTGHALNQRVAAMEQRMGTAKQPAKIFVYQGLSETLEEALARHFDGKGPPPDAEVVIYSLGSLEEAD